MRGGVLAPPRTFRRTNHGAGHDTGLRESLLQCVGTIGQSPASDHTMTSNLHTFYQRERARHGSFAVVIFVFSAALVHMANGGVSSLFTLKSALFFVIGIPIAITTLGPFGFALHRGVATLLFRGQSPPLAAGATMMVRLIDVALKVALVLLGWYLTSEAYHWLHDR